MKTPDKPERLLRGLAVARSEIATIHPQVSFYLRALIAAKGAYLSRTRTNACAQREWSLEQMETGALMMDAHEAVKCLDVYSDSLVSLSVLLGAKILEDKNDQEMRENYEGLQVKLRDKQKEAMALAIEIVTAKNRRGTVSDPSGAGINAAVQRYVAADNQASEALKKKDEATAPNAVSEALRRFRMNEGLVSK